MSNNYLPLSAAVVRGNHPDRIGFLLDAEEIIQTELDFYSTHMYLDWDFTHSSCMLLLVEEGSCSLGSPLLTFSDEQRSATFSLSPSETPGLHEWQAWGWINGHVLLARQKNIVTPLEQAMVSEHDPRLMERYRAEARRQSIQQAGESQPFQQGLQEVFATGSLEAEYCYTLLYFDASHE